MPINPTYTPSEIGYMLITGDVKGIVAPEQLLPVYEQVYEQLPSIEKESLFVQKMKRRADQASRKYLIGLFSLESL
ncbi:hypothetical protein BsIDN1_19000 [Bacillus safensis]|uniref:Uncharacterized protein n=1 Tax=Bacillus safensis TaxID=561879 RepID=A0A5S9M6M5_BACIA|nr:hypothetical protein BsIDN1_19000 [Bacillus safensis]